MDPDGPERRGKSGAKLPYRSLPDSGRDDMAKRTTNDFQSRLRKLPHVARLKRWQPFRSADQAELNAAADRIAGPGNWQAVAGWKPADVDCRLFHFATKAEADAMQRWIQESGIETRQVPARYAMPQLTVADYNRKP
jgi:hypothetical protein